MGNESHNTPSTALGRALFGAGVGATIISGAKAPLDGETWPTTLPVFLAAGVVAAVGIFLWRKALAAQKAQEIWERVMRRTQFFSFRADRTTENPAERRTPHGHDSLVTRVDALLDQYVLPMGERSVRALSIVSGWRRALKFW